MFQIKIEWLTTLIFYSNRVYKNESKKNVKNGNGKRKGKLLKTSPNTFSLFNIVDMSFFFFFFRIKASVLINLLQASRRRSSKTVAIRTKMTTLSH